MIKIVSGIFCYLLLSLPVAALDCFDMAGHDARIDPDLLRAIAWQESGFNFKAIGPNPITGYGIGLMQVDSQHLPWMASAYGIYQNQLTDDICINIYSGAYILALAFNKWGVSWEAVGAYNAGFARTPRQHQRRLAYASSIYNHYWRIKKRNAALNPSPDGEKTPDKATNRMVTDATNIASLPAPVLAPLATGH